jgi:hypothetical protein
MFCGNCFLSTPRHCLARMALPFRPLKVLLLHQAWKRARQERLRTTKGVFHRSKPSEITVELVLNTSSRVGFPLLYFCFFPVSHRDPGLPGTAEHPVPRIKLVFSSATESSSSDDADDPQASSNSSSLLRRIRHVSATSSNRPSSGGGARFEEIDDDASSSGVAGENGPQHGSAANTDGENGSLMRKIYGTGVVPVDEVTAPNSASASVASAPAENESSQNPEKDDDVVAGVETLVSQTLNINDHGTSSAEGDDDADDEREGETRAPRAKCVVTERQMCVCFFFSSADCNSQGQEASQRSLYRSLPFLLLMRVAFQSIDSFSTAPCQRQRIFRIAGSSASELGGVSVEAESRVC